MKELREVECLACNKIGLTCYGQCKNCGVEHEIWVHLSDQPDVRSKRHVGTYEA